MAETLYHASSPGWHEANLLLPGEAAAQALETIGISYDLSKMDRKAWACDLDGDRMCEIIFQERCWEWGYYYAYARIDGVWTQALCAAYGMQPSLYSKCPPPRLVAGGTAFNRSFR